MASGSQDGNASGRRCFTTRIVALTHPQYLVCVVLSRMGFHPPGTVIYVESATIGDD